MHLDGYEIGSKRILAEIEVQAFDDPPAAPRPSRPFTVSSEVRRPIAALESDTHELQLTVADIDQRLRRLPGRTFLLMTVLGMQALLALLIVYGDATRPLIPPPQFSSGVRQDLLVRSHPSDRLRARPRRTASAATRPS